MLEEISFSIQDWESFKKQKGLLIDLIRLDKSGDISLHIDDTLKSELFSVAGEDTTSLEERCKASPYDLLGLYMLYPRKAGKTQGLTRLGSLIKSQKIYDDVRQAILNYKDIIKARNTEMVFILHFSTFLSRYKDYLDEDLLKELRIKPDRNILERLK